MRKKQENYSLKRETIGCSVDGRMAQELRELVQETGVKKSELNRRALRKLIDGGYNEAQLMLNLVLLTQTVNDMKEEIPENHYKNLQQYIGNIMLIKGGKE